MGKIGNRLGISLFLFGGLVLVVISMVYQSISRSMVEEVTLGRLQSVAQQIASHIDSHLQEQVAIATTLVQDTVLQQALISSNAHYTQLSAERRQHEIAGLNAQWLATFDMVAPLIQQRLHNPTALLLKRHLNLFPHDYGEIFLTNRYGVMIAATGRLTTVAHAHKYWWQEAYDAGKGRVFIDDRGFDASVGDYVLGIVVPIRSEGQIIGLLKANVKILGPLNHMVEDFLQLGVGQLKVIRSGGEVLLADGVEPLSTRLPHAVVDSLHGKAGRMLLLGQEQDLLLGFAPVATTMNLLDGGYRFGGARESDDHHTGSEHESWYALIEYEPALSDLLVEQSIRWLTIVGLLFIAAMALFAWIVGSRLARPVVEIAAAAGRIGEGELDVRIVLPRDDEIGQLACALNTMATKIQSTLHARDKSEQALQQVLAELDVRVESQTREIQRQLDTALVRGERMAGIGSLVAGFTHDLNTPIAVALGSVGVIRQAEMEIQQLVQQDEVNEELLLRALHQIHEGGQLTERNLERAVEMVGSFKRTSIDQTSEQRREFALKRLLEDTVTSLYHYFKRATIEITIDCPAELRLDSCPGSLGQVFTNLLLNSYKHGFDEGQQHGHIHITAASHDGQLQIEYRDDGCGMSAESRARVFENFYSTAIESGGSGVGMHVSYLIIHDQLGGQMSCDSEPGEGVLFVIRIPLNSEEINPAG